MVPLAGILIVFGAVIGGFLLESRNVGVLAQPAELVIILGSALGAMLTANPVTRLAATVRMVWRAFREPVYTADRYLATLVMLYHTFQFARRQGAGALEEAIDNPDKSSLFAGHSKVVGNPEVLDFVCDTLRMCSLGSISPFGLDESLENDVELRRSEATGPVESLATLADSLPGFGIVAAVLGVILAMGSLREPPALMGLRIASALIGTFLGILLAYGLVAPISARLAKIEEAESQYFEMLRSGLVSFAKGMPAAIAVECARRAIPPEVRPNFEKTEAACRTAEPHTQRKETATEAA